MRSLKRSLDSCCSRIVGNILALRKKILDPRSPFLQKWNKIFVWSCVLAASLDLLFFYIPVIVDDKKCLGLDKKLQTAAIVLRSFSDIFYMIHMIFHFQTGFIAPSSEVYGRGELVKDASKIARRYLCSYFFIDILAVLPLPQVVVLSIIPRMGGSRSLNTKNLLKFVVLFQFVPRVLRVHPLYKEATITSGMFTETAWSGAAFNLFLYMLASHVLGAFWYLLSIERETTCWKKACGNRTECVNSSVYCDHNPGFLVFLNESCPIQTPNAALFDFGIFLDALQSGVVGSLNFGRKYLYCFWWGLQNLSSLGQNLKTSTFFGEILFAMFVFMSGVIYFSVLVVEIQKYLLQSTATRLEEWRVKMRDVEQWMSTRLLPADLRERIKQYEQYKWRETRGVDEENLIRNLPKDLRRDIKRHLGLNRLMRVPVFQRMDEQLLDALCGRLEQVFYTEGSFVMQEGKPVDAMLFIMDGKLASSTTNGGSIGFFNMEYLVRGDFGGEELLGWALDPRSSTKLPFSTRTVQALSEVEALVLKAEDLKIVASEFRKKLEEFLRIKEENRLQDALARGGRSLPSSGAIINVVRFAVNVIRAVRRNGSALTHRLPERIFPTMIQKPAEPDFIAEGNNLQNLFDDIVEETVAESDSTDFEEVSKGEDTASPSEVPAQARSHPKSCRDEDERYNKLSTQLEEVGLATKTKLEEVALAIKKLTDDRLNVNDLYEEVMKTKGFDELTLALAFDHLVENEKVAKAFMVKNARLRRAWLEGFLKTNA
ncbi:hypothetical protein RHSIM_Rhsim06G0037400 [Rhododendron simsii]|uniref:Cyclic nucleotide-binding domain-containing protein n=1 Tax=Rhododendron simsii TaxID=118357 RepID=A0A834LNK1_RHOSS|nr:hypothetical protein RHSIM_Rhsim06G0037400 [Rhododendron simsii]